MWDESSGQRSNPGKTRHCWSFVPFPCMGIESTALGFVWRHGQHPAAESNIPLNPLLWLDGFCRLRSQPLCRVMGLCVPQDTDGSFCFRGYIQAGSDGLTSPWSSSGTEGGLQWDSGLSRPLLIAHYSCAHYYLLQYLTVSSLPDTWTLLCED